MNYFKLKFLLLFFALAMAIPPAWAGTMTDVIDYNVTKDLIGNTGATAWAELEIEGPSGAKYVLYTMGNLNENQGICWNKNGYLYTTTSPGKLKSVTFIGNTGTGNKRAVNIFAQNIKYTEKASGTYIKQVQFDNEGITYSFTDEYKYIAINGTASSTLINSISIEWETEGGGETPVKQDLTTFEFSSATASATLGQAFTAPTLTVNPTVDVTDVTYSSSDPDVATVANDGTVTLVGAGTTTITASFAGNDAYNAATASYNLTVNAAQPTGLITDFYESFNKCNGSGGNDNKWSGSIASSNISTDNPGWTFENEGGAYQCIKLGTTKNGGSAVTPNITVIPGITYTLTFKAGAWDGSSESTTLNISATGGTLSAYSVTLEKAKWNDYTITLTPTENTVTITFSETGGNHRFFLDEVRLTHDQNATPVTVVAKPEFSVAGGSYTEAQSVEISCATEGASIYYTLDGTDPTAESTPYTGAAISINETTTLKAIAVKDGQSSAVAEATYTIKTVTSVANLQAANALVDGTEFIYTGEAVVVWRDGSQMWLQDPNANEGGALVYDTDVVPSFSSKDKLKSGWTAKKGKYNNASQFTEFSAEKEDYQQEASPFERTSISADNVHEYVILKGVSISSDKKLLTFPGENGSTLTVYNKFNKLPETINATSTYDIDGIIVLYGGNAEIYPLGYEEHTAAVVEVKAPEFTYNNEAITGSSVEVNANDKITITSEEGTTLIYTTDGSNPSESATALQTDGNTAEVTITEACTIKAVALDGDANESEVATLAVTISEPVQPGEGRTYQKVTSTGQLTEGKYLIVYNGDELMDKSYALNGGLTELDAVRNTVEVTINGNQIETDANAYFTIKAINRGGSYSIQSASGKYIGGKAKGINVSDTYTEDYAHTISFDADGNAELVSKGVYLKFNNASDQSRFRYYASGQQPIQLYKEVTGEPVVTPVITVDHTQLTINDETGNDKTGALTATVEPAAEITAETSTNMWTANVAENKVTYNGRALHETGTVTYKSEGATDVTADLEYNYTGPLYILGYVNGGDWSANNAVQMEGPSTEGLYTATFTTTPNANNQSEISFTKRKGSDWDKWSEIYDYRFVPVSNGPWVLADETTNVYCDLDFDPAHVDNQKIVMPAGKYTVTIDAKNNKFKIEPVAKQDLELAFEPTAANAYVGENVTEPALKGLPEGLAVTYSSSKTEVATVDANTGEVTAVAAGEAVITATFEGNNEYNQATATYTLTVKAKENVTLTFDKENVELYAGQEFTAPTLSGLPEGATVTYTVTNTDPEVEVAKVENNVVVLTGNAGTATVTATYAGDASHNSATATYTITVKNKPLTITLDPASGEYTVGKEAKVKVTVENAVGESEVEYVASYTVNEEVKTQTLTADTEGYVTLPNDKAVTYTLTVTALDDRMEEVTVTGNYTFTAAPAIGITLTATPEAETYTVGDKVNVKVATTGTIGDNVLITYTTNFTRDAEQTYDNEKGIDITSDQAGTVTLTVNVYDGYEHKDAVEGITTKTADYTFVKAPAIGITFDPASGKEFTVGDDAKVKVTIANTIGEDVLVEYKIDEKEVEPDAGYIILPNDKAGDVTLKVTVVDGYEHEGDSEASATYKFKAAEPIQITLDPAEGSYTVGTEVKVNVKIENTIGDYLATYTINDGEEQEFDGNDIVIPSDQIATVTLAVSVTDAYHDGVTTVTGQYVFSPMPVVAMPTFSLVAGSYTGAQTVIINCATEGATISYSTDGGQTWTKGNTVNVDKDMTIMAKAERDGMTVSTTASATYVIITEETPETVNIVTGYYQIKNLGNGLYANVAGRKTLNFTDAPADKAGTVIYVDVENDGTVKSLRSQAADLQRYADRAMSYVPEVVKIVAQKLNADGSGEILGETGLNKILDKFNECFDHNLHVEQAEGGYRLYGKTPSMQPVVEFYRENKDKVEAKLPNLEAFINSALEKLKAKIGGSSVFTEFKLHDIWDKMGGTLTEPVDAASTMAFYREVLNNKNYVWDFAYQTAMIYVNNLMSHPRWPEVEEKLGEYAQYIDKIKQIRPEFKYYIVQKDGKPDFISEGNKDIIDDDPRTIWSLEKRTDFTVNFPEANKHNGEYVTTLYTDFAYTLPEGVTAYAVTEVSTQGVATLTALEGTIPAQTPVLLKSTADGAQTVTLSTEAGTAPADNLLVGPDYLIKHYEFKTPQVVDIFNFIKDKLPGFYEEYVAQYEYLMLKTAGTVGNKYFWNVNSDLDDLKDDCIVRSLAVDENGTLAFSDHWTTETNKAFLVDDANNPQDVIKLPSLRGDINKDGVISIIDVTALIDILLDLPDRTYLNPTDTYPKGLDYEAADVNEEKGIEITDVTTLIDILLNMPDQPAQGSGN